MSVQCRKVTFLGMKGVSFFASINQNTLMIFLYLKTINQWAEGVEAVIEMTPDLTGNNKNTGNQIRWSCHIPGTVGGLES